MPQRAVGQFPLQRFDRPANPPALRNADHAVAGDVPLGQGIDNAAYADRIQPHRMQQAGAVDVGHWSAP